MSQHDQEAFSERYRMSGRQRRTRMLATWTIQLVVLSSVLVACGSGDDDAGESGSGSAQTAPSSVSESTRPRSTSSTSTVPLAQVRAEVDAWVVSACDAYMATFEMPAVDPPEHWLPDFTRRRVERMVEDCADQRFEALAAAEEAAAEEARLAEEERRRAEEEARRLEEEARIAALMTMTEFEQIQTGMSYRRVVEIVGSEGELVTSSTFYDITTEMYEWSGLTAYSSGTVMIQDGAVVMKSQFGLT